MNLFKKLANQTAIYGLSSVIGRLLNYLLVPLYTRYFLPSEYGVVTEMYAYVAFLVVFLTYGLETAFFRFINSENDPKKVYSTALISLIVSSSVFVLILFTSASSVASILGHGIQTIFVQWFSIIIGLDAVSSISFAKLRGEERAVKFAAIKLFTIFSNILLNLYFIVYKGFGIEYIFISNLISSTLTVLCLLPTMIKIRFVFEIALWKKMMLYALPLLIAGLAGMINETIDRVLLKHLLSNTDSASHELGLYGAFYKISIIMLLFVQTFRYAAEPFFFSQHKNQENKKIYADVMNYFTICMTIIFLVVIIFYDYIILFLGSEYHDERGFLVVSLLMLANLFLGIFFNLSIWYKLIDKTIYGAYLAIFGATITLVLNIILIPKIGFIGSALATLACYFSMALLSYFLSRKHFKIPYQIGKISLYLFAMMAIYFIVYNQYFNLGFNFLLLVGFIIFVYISEKIKLTR